MSLIDPELIQVNVEASDWKDAIKKAVQPFVEHNKVTDKYSQRIIEIAKETGPYIVIAPHVALPHASSKDGVLADAIGLTILKTPVAFGNKDNDPVKYLFTLSSVKPEGHLDQMAELVQVLQKQNLYKQLDEAQDAAEVDAIVNNN
ncbi:MAG TPA: PTS sugar transporter subunit IIA [Candidatus Limosilactobacillus merdipullorum]|uniref:Ascorbate-specific PTS system EIIA component n=1 Tax=Candidatus Limosilactobacillus merdipullorum TaxID=2838653 RepID=A0A9D1U4K0_9LACO|nr:PTS sugar transporter subunit IIA [Candidatus Limosilactobacillus merdipullorum]